MNKVFKDINRNVLINILNEKISDKRFIDLISSMHKVNLLCLDGFLIQKINGIIKRSILSPLLCNIYFDKLDSFIKGEIKNKMERGTKPSMNPKYGNNIDIKSEERNLPLHIQNTIKKSRRRQIEKTGIKNIIEHEEFVRIKYVRYGSEFIVGVRGSLELATKIKILIENFLKGVLHLTLNTERTKITNTYSDRVQFLGVLIYNIDERDLPYKNSRAIENEKRVAKRNQIFKANVTNKILKFTRQNILFALNSEKHREAVLDLGREVVGKVKTVRAVIRVMEQAVNKLIVHDPREKELTKDKVSVLHSQVNKNVKQVSDTEAHIVKKPTIIIDKALVYDKLKLEKLINTKLKPCCKTDLITVSDYDIIFFFNKIAYRLLNYFRCTDDFFRMKSIVNWFIRYSAILTIKSKHKLASKKAVIDRYGKDLTFTNHLGNKISLISPETVMFMKKRFLTDSTVT
jgi:arsenate reductase-like glutaredoxin family protein